MKEKLIALLVVSVMVASALGAMSLSATKVGATGESLTLASSNYTPAAGQQYTLSGQLRDSGGNPLAYKPIDIFYHFPGGGWQFSNTVYTGTDGKYSATTSSSQTIYLQTGYKVGSAYLASSNVVTINVSTSPTLTLTSTNYSPAPGQQYTLSGLLTRGPYAPLANQPIDIYYHLAGGNWQFSNTVYTDANGKFSTTTSSSQTAILQAGYKAKGVYLASSNVVTINVQQFGSTPTALRIEAQTQTPTPNQGNHMTVRLWSGTSVLGGKTVELHVTGSNTYLYSVTTYAADGAAMKDVRLPAGEYWVYAAFAGSADFAPCRSNAMYVKVAATAPTKKPTTLYVYTGAPNQKTTVNTPFVLNGALETGGTPIGNKPLTISYLYKAPSGSWSAVKILATIDSGNGFYSYLWKAPAKGEYVFRVGYDGDSGYSGYYGSASNDLHVIVS